MPEGMKLAFEPQSPAAQPDAGDVRILIDRVNQTPAEDFAGVMESTIAMDAFLQTTAVMLFAGAFDQLTGWNPHNYCLYHEPQSDRWHYLPFDLDVGFADNAFGQVPVLARWHAAWPIPGGPPRPLLERIVNDPQLLARYRRLADTILEKHFHPDVLLPKFDALYYLVKDDLADDPFPHGRVTNPEDRDYESIILSMKAFVRQRYETARHSWITPVLGLKSHGICRAQPAPRPAPRPRPATWTSLAGRSQCGCTCRQVPRLP